MQLYQSSYEVISDRDMYRPNIDEQKIVQISDTIWNPDFTLVMAYLYIFAQVF